MSARLGVVFACCVSLLVAAAAAMWLFGGGDPARSSAPLASPQSPPSASPAAVPTSDVVEPATPAPPRARFTRVMSAATTLASAAPYLNRCAGPVAINVGAASPLLIAEHDYCGGSSWISKLMIGDAVDLGGPGVDRGLYVVEGRANAPRATANLSNLPDGDVVLETSISKTQLILVSLRKAEGDWAAFTS